MIEVKESRPSNEEIVKAMQTLKDTCSCYEDCKDCPLCISKYHECYVDSYQPCHWDINTPEETTWKAFKE